MFSEEGALGFAENRLTLQGLCRPDICFWCEECVVWKTHLSGLCDGGMNALDLDLGALHALMEQHGLRLGWK